MPQKQIESYQEGRYSTIANGLKGHHYKLLGLYIKTVDRIGVRKAIELHFWINSNVTSLLKLIADCSAGLERSKLAAGQMQVHRLEIKLDDEDVYEPTSFGSPA